VLGSMLSLPLVTLVTLNFMTTNACLVSIGSVKEIPNQRGFAIAMLIR